MLALDTEITPPALSIEITPPALSIEMITPAVALSYLDTNPDHQRKLKPSLVERLVLDIINGNWVLNGASISFDTKGCLLDGQHRLRACIKANTPIQSVVVRGIDPLSFTTIDFGIKRSMADVLTTLGYRNAVFLATVLRRLTVLSVHPDCLTPQHNSLVTVGDMLQTLNNNDDLPAFVTNHLSSVKSPLLATTIPLTMMSAIRRTGYLDQMKDFFHAVLNEQTPEAGNPAHMLRQRLVRARLGAPVNQLSGYIKVALTIKAWNYWATGTEVYILKYAKFSKKPESFPTIFPLDYS